MLQSPRCVPGGEASWQPLIFGYHLLVRRAVTGLVRDLGLNWQRLAEDGSCEVWGLTAPMLECISLPARPLGEIHAWSASDRKITDLGEAGGSSRRSRLLCCGVWL